jgi:alpha-D-ribose 1-methylphosphonate 5-triphosphate synthase subunit PhnL
MFSKALFKQFGEIRGQKIKETILQAMLYAEEKFGIGSGDQKWTEAWRKIIELLGKQGIVLKNKEITYVQDLMKSAIPEINAITYSALPDEIKSTRNVKIAIPEVKVLLDKLREKYPDCKK